MSYITFAEARDTQAEALGAAIGRLEGQLDAWAEAGRVTGAAPVFVGIGASLAAACAPVWELRSRGIDAIRLGAGDNPVPFPRTDRPVFGISQSGRSAETLAVLDSVDERLRYAIVNTHPSPMTALVEKTLQLGSIPDSYASTIGFTSTVAALGMIADVWNGGVLHAGWRSLAATFARVEADIAPVIPALAQAFAGTSGDFAQPTADFVGAGPAVGSAEAGALLFREVARIPATAMSTRQYLHGSMESAGDGVHVVFGSGREIILAQTLADAGHRVVLISGEDVPASERMQTVCIPAVPAAQRAILEALVMQMLVAEVAKLRGVDVEEFVFHNSDTKVSADAGAGA